MTERESTACADCQRAVYVEDVDKEGRCIFCRPTAVQPPKKGAPAHADEDATA